MIKFKEEVLNVLSKNLNLKNDKIEELLSYPPKKDMGDLSFPCFIVAKENKENPAKYAQNLCEKINSSLKSNYIHKVINFGPYINFFINQNKFFNEFINNFLDKGISKRKNNKKNIVVE